MPTTIPPQLDLAEFKAALIRAKLTQRDLSLRLQVPETRLSAIIRGRASLPDGLIGRIAAELGIAPEAILASPQGASVEPSAITPNERGR